MSWIIFLSHIVSDKNIAFQSNGHCTALLLDSVNCLVYDTDGYARTERFPKLKCTACPEARIAQLFKLLLNSV